MRHTGDRRRDGAKNATTGGTRETEINGKYLRPVQLRFLWLLKTPILNSLLCLDSHDPDSKYRANSPDDRSHSKKDKKEKRQNHDKESSKSYDEDLTIPDSGPTLSSLGYSNVDNPFNDVNIESKFVWSKKQHRDKKLGLSPAEIARRERDRRLDTQSEIEKLQKRRVEREIEMTLREEELSRMQRESEAAMMGDWQAKEDEVVNLAMCL